MDDRPPNEPVATSKEMPASSAVFSVLRDITFYGTVLWASAQLNMDPDVALKVVCEAKLNDFGFTEGGIPAWRLSESRVVELELDHYDLVQMLVYLRINQGTKQGYLFSPGAFKPRYTLPAARKKMAKMYEVVRAIPSLWQLGIRGPSLRDVGEVHLSRKGNFAELEAFRKYYGKVASSVMQQIDKDVDDLDPEEEVTDIVLPNTPIRAVIFGGQEDFIKRKYAPAIAKYGVQMLKNYPYKVRGKGRAPTIPPETTLIIVMMDISGHHGANGSTVALKLARKYNIPWIAIPRKISHAVEMLREKGFIPPPRSAKPKQKVEEVPVAIVPKAPQGVAQGSQMTSEPETQPATGSLRPQAIARKKMWVSWALRRTNYLSDESNSISFDLDSTTYRIGMCPSFEEDGNMNKDHGKLIVARFPVDGPPEFIGRNTLSKRIHAAASDAWDRFLHAGEAPTSRPVVEPDPVVEDVPDPVVEDVPLANEKATPPTPTKHHPYDDFTTVMDMLTDVMKRLGFSSLTVATDGSFTIHRAVT